MNVLCFDLEPYFQKCPSNETELGFGLLSDLIIMGFQFLKIKAPLNFIQIPPVVTDNSTYHELNLIAQREEIDVVPYYMEISDDSLQYFHTTGPISIVRSPQVFLVNGPSVHRVKVAIHKFFTPTAWALGFIAYFCMISATILLLHPNCLGPFHVALDVSFMQKKLVKWRRCGTRVFALITLWSLLSNQVLTEFKGQAVRLMAPIKAEPEFSDLKELVMLIRNGNYQYAGLQGWEECPTLLLDPPSYVEFCKLKNTVTLPTQRAQLDYVGNHERSVAFLDCETAITTYRNNNNLQLVFPPDTPPFFYPLMAFPRVDNQSEQAKRIEFLRKGFDEFLLRLTEAGLMQLLFRRYNILLTEEEYLDLVQLPRNASPLPFSSILIPLQTYALGLVLSFLGLIFELLTHNYHR